MSKLEVELGLHRKELLLENHNLRVEIFNLKINK